MGYAKRLAGNLFHITPAGMYVVKTGVLTSMFLEKIPDSHRERSIKNYYLINHKSKKGLGRTRARTGNRNSFIVKLPALSNCAILHQINTHTHVFTVKIHLI